MKTDKKGFTKIVLRLLAQSVSNLIDLDRDLDPLEDEIKDTREVLDLLEFVEAQDNLRVGSNRKVQDALQKAHDYLFGIWGDPTQARRAVKEALAELEVKVSEVPTLTKAESPAFPSVFNPEVSGNIQKPEEELSIVLHRSARYDAGYGCAVEGLPMPESYKESPYPEEFERGYEAGLTVKKEYADQLPTKEAQ